MDRDNQHAPIAQVAIDRIKIPDDRPAAKLEMVTRLAENIEEFGLLHPIALTDASQEGDLVLISGLHRLEACKQLGWLHVPARTFSATDVQAKCMEIAENLCRNHLSAIETGKLFQRYQEYQESLHPEIRRGVAGGKAIRKNGGTTDKMSVVENLAAKTGKNVRTIHRDTAMARAIPDEVAEQVIDTPIADHKSQLRKLGKLKPDKQKAVVEHIKAGKSKTVEEAAKKVFPADADLPPCQEDDNGVEVAAELIPVFEARSEWRRIGRDFQKLIHDVETLCDTKAGYYLEGDCGLRECLDNFMGAMPSLVAEGDPGFYPARHKE